MSAILIGGYVLGGLISVPLIARAVYEPGEWLTGSKEFCIGASIVNAVFWPIWAGIGAVALLSRLLAPVIFRGSDGER